MVNTWTDAGYFLKRPWNEDETSRHLFTTDKTCIKKLCKRRRKGTSTKTLQCLWEQAEQISRWTDQWWLSNSCCRWYFIVSLIKMMLLFLVFFVPKRAIMYWLMISVTTEVSRPRKREWWYYCLYGWLNISFRCGESFVKQKETRSISHMVTPTSLRIVVQRVHWVLKFVDFLMRDVLIVISIHSSK